MDSMTKSLAERYSHLMVKVEEQDDNDQTKALHFVLANYPEVDTVHFIAATGKREDHTVGNLGLLMEYARPSTGSGTGRYVRRPSSSREEVEDSLSSPLPVVATRPV